jgi:antirestriction protein ArdC
MKKQYNKSQEEKISVAEKVTNKIIEKLEQGIIPWKKPWTGQSARNWVTQKPYRGVNKFLLDDGEYISFKQCTDAGGKIKKGAKASMVVYYKLTTYENKESDGDTETTSSKTIPFMRFSNVFNINDCEGIESKIKPSETIQNNPIEDAQELFQNYLNQRNCSFETNDGSDRAFYSPSCDKIIMPSIKQFNCSEEYYSTLFHEGVHSTGHSSRLKRITEFASFGSQIYSKEELCAEIGSAILCEKVNIDISKTFDNSVAYIQSWLKVLKNDKNLIISAASQAEKAVELILKEKGGE